MSAGGPAMRRILAWRAAALNGYFGYYSARFALSIPYRLLRAASRYVYTSCRAVLARFCPWRLRGVRYFPPVL